VNKERVLLSRVIEAAVEVCKPDIDARRLHFGVDVEGSAERFIVEADAARLQQVFWNLLKNSVKFTPTGGCVGVRCREEDGQAVVEVHDSGIGIEAEMLPHVFDAFAQAERSLARQFGGLGLGLTIGKALVELHGGTIEAHSDGRDKGTTFRVRLPLVKGEQPFPSRETPAASSPVSRKLRILLVDDHGDTVEMLKLILESEGHEVHTAGDVATALEAASLAPFDLLLSDLGLPDRSGLDLMRELRALGRKMPSIALSGYGHDRDIEQSRAAGFSEHVVKPADPRFLLRTIDKLVRRLDAT
jgi:CheY-like chemotaxis protein